MQLGGFLRDGSKILVTIYIIFFRVLFISKMYKKSLNRVSVKAFLFVPGTGFEPAHPCERCHLKAVRLPISPPGQTAGLRS